MAPPQKYALQTKDIKKGHGKMHNAQDVKEESFMTGGR
jgi:hypothetical protein